MREILSELDEWQAAGEEIALATLVDTHGPSPRQAGARLCCTRTGRMIGSVSGGCIEADVVEHAFRVLDRHEPVVQRYGIDDDVGIAVGLSCGGEVDVLIEPFEPDPAWIATRQSMAEGLAVAHCAVVAPAAWMGRHLCVREDGSLAGGIEAEIDAQLRVRCLALFADGGQRLEEVDLPDGDVARVFVQAIVPKPRLFVVGATHIAIPLTRMARELGFEVSVVDPRTPFATPERFPNVDHLVLEWPGAVLDAADLDDRAHIVSLSHDLKFDLPTLERALRSQVRYIGALGSRRTHEKRLGRLRELGFEDVDLARIHTPIGLDIGAESPEEIALAILAEIVATRRGRAGARLRDRTSRIHAPDEARPEEDSRGEERTP